VKLAIPPRAPGDGESMIVARDLTAKFGDFTAVDRASFTIARGEIFGFVGSNGSGKTTTMKMLTGLLPANGGEAQLLGKPVDATDPKARRRIGYMSQSFSLYTELTVRQNLELHARLFHLPRDKTTARVAELAEQFGLTPYLDQNTASLPLGMRQRLSLAIAVVHDPEILILDEPTSGVDPIARDRFWQILADLSRRQNVTIFISTHFMNEAARCDRISLMHEGRTLATGKPSDLIAARRVETLEQAFIAYLEEASGTASPPPGPIIDAKPAPIGTPHSRTRIASTRRTFAYAVRETVELIRDPIRLSFALFGTALLMVIFGYGITADVDNLTFAALDRDRTPESRGYISAFSSSRYFTEKSPIADYTELDRRLRSGDVRAVIEIPPEFGRNLKKGTPMAVGAWIDGSMPFRAETIRGYMLGVHEHYSSDPTIRTTQAAVATEPATIAMRFRYNQDFKSIYAMAPSSMALLLVMIPAILMAVAIVREKELGSITNLYVTPVKRLEFLLGKQLPYIAVSMVSFASLVAITIFLFAVPLKGSLAALTVGALIYVTATTGIGILISAFTRTQIAALVGTAILTTVPAVQFSGMLTPVSSLTGAGAIIGQLFPMTYFLNVSVGVFTKGLGLRELAGQLLALAAFIPVLMAASVALLRKQER
jgi:ribosome-dependent ATPase